MVVVKKTGTAKTPKATPAKKSKKQPVTPVQKVEESEEEESSEEESSEEEVPVVKSAGNKRKSGTAPSGASAAKISRAELHLAYVGNLPLSYSTREKKEKLQALFVSRGLNVTKVSIRSRSGHVGFASSAELQQAVAMSDLVMDGTPITVEDLGANKERLSVAVLTAAIDKKQVVEATDCASVSVLHPRVAAFIRLSSEKAVKDLLKKNTLEVNGVVHGLEACGIYGAKAKTEVNEDPAKTLVLKAPVIDDSVVRNVTRCVSVVPKRSPAVAFLGFKTAKAAEAALAKNTVEIGGITYTLQAKRA